MNPMTRRDFGLIAGGWASAALGAAPPSRTRPVAAVVTAWESSTGKHTWRNPSRWDARVLGALSTWGYQPSEVEGLLLTTQPTDDQPVAV